MPLKTLKTEAKFGSIVTDYLNRISKLDEDEIEELHKKTSERIIERIKSVPPVIVDMERFNELIPEVIDLDTVKQDIHALMCNLPLSFVCQYNDMKIEYAEGSEIPIQGHWTGDWFDNYFNIELKRGEFVIRSNRQFEKVKLYFTSEGKGYLELQDADHMYDNLDDTVWVPLTDFVCNLHFLGE